MSLQKLIIMVIGFGGWETHKNGEGIIATNVKVTILYDVMKMSQT